MATDLPLLFVVLLMSAKVRLGMDWTPAGTQLTLMLVAPFVAIPIFACFGLYRSVMRHLPDRAIWTISQAMAVTGLVSLGLAFLADKAVPGVVPRTVPFLYWALGTIAVSLSRFSFRSIYIALLGGRPRRRRVLVYGAGSAGVQVAEALRSGGMHKVIGFIDENPRMRGTSVAGVPLHRPEEIAGLVRKYNVEEVIQTAPSMSAAARTKLLAGLANAPVAIRVLPTITDLARGKYVVSQLRQIDIDELLGRSSVPADPALLRAMIEDRSILVTGAGGSIGSELVRLIVRWRPKKVVLLEVNEFALYEIERELTTQNAPIVSLLGSVTDAALLDGLFAEHEIEVVLHAAANKHVPLVEHNVCEAIRNNVVGTRRLAEAARAAGVKRFVLVSTDKAVHPKSAMGATKRWAEHLIGHLDKQSHGTGCKTRFCAVRFGNVLGSRGSVVPLFKEQIAAGGPITVTDPSMSRYFMSIHEAAELIVQAGAICQSGEVFVLDMGKPVKIIDLARQMVMLSGLSLRSADNPDGNIEIRIIGARCGEKVHEELFYKPDWVVPTVHPKILSATGARVPATDILEACDSLAQAAARHDEAEARRILFESLGQWKSAARAAGETASASDPAAIAPVRPDSVQSA